MLPLQGQYIRREAAISKLFFLDFLPFQLLGLLQKLTLLQLSLVNRRVHTSAVFIAPIRRRDASDRVLASQAEASLALGRDLGRTLQVAAVQLELPIFVQDDPTIL